MKKLFILLFVSVSSIVLAQDMQSMNDVEGRSSASMAEVEGNSEDGVYRYYLKGSSTPYTGILFSNHPNGQIDSWQEYENGVGQGKWINYYDNGNFKEVGYYQQNRVEGPIQKYFPNGQLKAEGTYKDWRIKVGTWIYYTEDGKVASSIDYGEKGSIEEVNEYFQRGDISKRWYDAILTSNSFM